MEDDNGVTADLNANLKYQSTGDPQLDKAVLRWLAWDRVSDSQWPGEDGDTPSIALAAAAKRQTKPPVENVTF